MLSLDITTLVAGLACGAGSLLARLGWTGYRRQARALTSDVQAIANARSGKVQLMGRLISDETIESPVSKKRCLFLKIVFSDLSAPDEIQVSGSPAYGGYRLQSSSGRSKEVITRMVDHVYLEDESGRVEIDLHDADLELSVDRSFETGPLSKNDPETVVLMRRFGAHFGAGGGVGRCRLSETILEPGDLAIITGRLTMDGAGNLLVSGTPDDPLFVSDKPPDEVAREASNKARGLAILTWCLVLIGVMLVALSFLTAEPDSRPPPLERPADTSGKY
ncbi:MAG TPA: GIDE domain-containing protein [Myxococcota bacterium]|nr:GIDE domain-containing protein [Myxococcota bacterium]